MSVVPGVESYSDVVRPKHQRNETTPKTYIFSSSITRDIDQGSFNRGFTQGRAEFHMFRGKKGKHITQYMTTHLLEGEGDANTVVLIAGGNDIPNTRHLNNEELEEIADHLIRGGRNCKENYGVTNVVISNILPRSNSFFQCNRHLLNQILKRRCSEENFIFMENVNIILRNHVGFDGVHLNAEGSDLLKTNLLNVLSNMK